MMMAAPIQVGCQKDLSKIKVAEDRGADQLAVTGRSQHRGRTQGMDSRGSGPAQMNGWVSSSAFSAGFFGTAPTREEEFI